MKPVLDIIDLYKNYGPVDVLKNINVSIEPGDFLVLVGPSGCGKSSLVKAGLLPQLSHDVISLYVEATPDAGDFGI